MSYAFNTYLIAMLCFYFIIIDIHTDNFSYNLNSLSSLSSEDEDMRLEVTRVLNKILVVLSLQLTQPLIRNKFL